MGKMEQRDVRAETREYYEHRELKHIMESVSARVMPHNAVATEDIEPPTSLILRTPATRQFRDTARCAIPTRNGSQAKNSTMSADTSCSRSVSSPDKNDAANPKNRGYAYTAAPLYGA